MMAKYKDDNILLLDHSTAANSGAALVAKTLRALGVQYVFGVVGIPITDIAEACIHHGIRFIGMRNEQSASYAAGAYGYLTGKPGVCLTVSGPGFINALSGIANALENSWPVLFLSGASESFLEGMGAFQEWPQMKSVESFIKFAQRPTSVGHIPRVLQNAMNVACAGRPGPSYVEIPADLITASNNQQESDMEHLSLDVPGNSPSTSVNAPFFTADPSSVSNAASWLSNARQPLIVFGKGAAYSRAETQAEKFLQSFKFPFIATPMAKGLVSDLHPSCVAAARSFALQNADVVLVVGAKLNWMLHFGQPPRYSSDVKIIQIDICPEEMGRNIPSHRHCALAGHIPLVMNQLATALSKLPSFSTRIAPWMETLQQKCTVNRLQISKLCQDHTVPMTYYCALGEIKKSLADKWEQCVLVSEGANTMDIARTVFDMTLPRHRLDAGSMGTMGVGAGFAIASQMVYPTKRIISIQGDSAFGFSAMELETAARYRIPLLVFIINNSGIYSGLESEVFNKMSPSQIPSTALTPECRYEKIAESVGGQGWFVRTPEELRKATKEAWEIGERRKCVCVVNVVIGTDGKRKRQEFSWQSRAVDSSKSKL